MKSTFGVGQFPKAVSKSIDGLFPRMESHMLLFGREMDKIALQHKGRDSPGNFLAYFRVSAVNQCSQSNHPLL